MKVAGIIAEYNPFHNGHAYQLKKAKEELHADHLIIAMSGDFLQRGVPAILDKYTRAQMALAAGADLVLELPARWACASAEYFATAGVTLLAKTGVVQTLCYGCEDVEPALVRALSDALLEESARFSATLQAQVKQGMPYPAARSKAACLALSGYKDFDTDSIRAFLASPNNILALEYEKAITQWNAKNPKKLQGHSIRRVGEGYHSTRLDETFASATAIRAQLHANCPGRSRHLALCGADDPGDALSPLREQVPSCTYALLANAAQNHQLLTPDDFSDALYTRLWALRETGYEDFADCDAPLSHRIRKNLDSFAGFAQFASLLKSRNLTYTRVCRALLHILLDIRRTDYAALRTEAGLPYLRILGFRREAEPLLSAIKKEASAPLVTKVADAPHILSHNAMQILQQDIRCSDLYRTIAAMRSGSPLPNEYTRGILRI